MEQVQNVKSIYQDQRTEDQVPLRSNQLHVKLIVNDLVYLQRMLETEEIFNDIVDDYKQHPHHCNLEFEGDLLLLGPGDLNLLHNEIKEVAKHHQLINPFDTGSDYEHSQEEHTPCSFLEQLAGIVSNQRVDSCSNYRHCKDQQCKNSKYAIQSCGFLVPLDSVRFKSYVNLPHFESEIDDADSSYVHNQIVNEGNVGGHDVSQHVVFSLESCFILIVPQTRD